MATKTTAPQKIPRNTLAALKKAKRVTNAGDDDDLSELIKDEDIQSCVSVDDACVHDGDLTVEGDLDLFDGAVLIVKGNLTVSEAVLTDETATLVVTGKLKCRHLFLEGNLEIQQGATMSGVIFGFYEAGMSRIHGTTKAKVALIGNHDFETDDEDYKTVARFSNHHELSEGDPAELEKVLGAKAFKGLSRLMGISDAEEGDEEDGNDAWSLKLLRHL